MYLKFFSKNIRCIFTEAKIRYLIIWYLEFRYMFTVFCSLFWLQRCATWHIYHKILLSKGRSPFWECWINPVVLRILGSHIRIFVPHASYNVPEWCQIKGPIYSNARFSLSTLHLLHVCNFDLILFCFVTWTVDTVRSWLTTFYFAVIPNSVVYSYLFEQRIFYSVHTGRRFFQRVPTNRQLNRVFRNDEDYTLGLFGNTFSRLFFDTLKQQSVHKHLIDTHTTLLSTQWK